MFIKKRKQPFSFLPNLHFLPLSPSLTHSPSSLSISLTHSPSSPSLSVPLSHSFSQILPISSQHLLCSSTCGRWKLSWQNNLDSSLYAKRQVWIIFVGANLKFGNIDKLACLIVHNSKVLNWGTNITIRLPTL